MEFYLLFICATGQRMQQCSCQVGADGRRRGAAWTWYFKFGIIAVAGVDRGRVSNSTGLPVAAHFQVEVFLRFWDISSFHVDD